MNERVTYVPEKATESHFFSIEPVNPRVPGPRETGIIERGELIECFRQRYAKGGKGGAYYQSWFPTDFLREWLTDRAAPTNVRCVALDGSCLVQIKDEKLAFEFRMRFC